MIVRRPSGSKIGMFLECRGPALLPWGPDSVSDVAAKGTRIHAALERFYLGARVEDIRHMLREGDAGDLEILCKAAPAIVPIHGLPLVEVECWYDPVTQDAILGVPGDLPPDGYWRGRTDLLGTVDQSDGLYFGVVDHKTGNPFFQTPPRSSAQIAYFGVWLKRHVARYLKSMRPELLVQGQVFLTQKHEVVTHTWHPEELNEWAETFAELELDLRAYESGAKTLDQLVLTPSQKTCQWCPVSGCSQRYQKARKTA